MLHVIFINGNGGSGKDAFVQIVSEANYVTRNVSSIDCIRKLLEISSSDKRPETRKVLADVGASLEEYNQYRSRLTAREVAKHVNEVPRYLPTNSVSFVFVHVREAYMRERIRLSVLSSFENWSGKPHFAFTNLLMVRPGAAETLNNASDAETARSQPADYDYTLVNDGNLDDLAGSKLTEFIAYLKDRPLAFANTY